MRRFVRLLDRHFEEVICATLLGLLVLLLCLQVGLRFLFSVGLAWNEEVERFVFVWLTYLGASLGVQRQGHIRITSFVNLAPEGLPRQLVILLSDLIWLIFSLFIVYLGVELLKTMAHFKHLSPATGINMVWIYAIVPLAFLLMSFRLVQIYYCDAKRLLRSRRSSETSGAGEGSLGKRGLGS